MVSGDEEVSAGFGTWEWNKGRNLRWQMKYHYWTGPKWWSRFGYVVLHGTHCRILLCVPSWKPTCLCSAVETGFLILVHTNDLFFFSKVKWNAAMPTMTWIRTLDFKGRFYFSINSFIFRNLVIISINNIIKLTHFKVYWKSC